MSARSIQPARPFGDLLTQAPSTLSTRAPTLNTNTLRSGGGLAYTPLFAKGLFGHDGTLVIMPASAGRLRRYLQ